MALCSQRAAQSRVNAMHGCLTSKHDLPLALRNGCQGTPGQRMCNSTAAEEESVMPAKPHQGDWQREGQARAGHNARLRASPVQQGRVLPDGQGPGQSVPVAQPSRVADLHSAMCQLCLQARCSLLGLPRPCMTLACQLSTCRLCRAQMQARIQLRHTSHATQPPAARCTP